jgi:hypothetical protein
LIRSVALFFASLFLVSLVAAAQDSSPSPQRLELTTQLEKSEYCLQPNGFTSLRLYLRLRFQNISHQKVLLSLRSNVIDGMDLVAFHPASVPQPWPHITIDRLVQHKENFPPSSPGDDFATLKRGKSFETNAEVHIDLMHSKLPGGGPVPPGKYSLAIAVATWFDTDAAADAARQLWSHSGYLQSADVTSLPMKFTVDANPNFRDCGWTK